MSEPVRRSSPIRPFLAVFLPGAGLTVALGLLAVERAPDFAPAIVLGSGFLAFLVAVGRALAVTLGSPQGGRTGAVVRLLDLRRNRGRYALIFAVVAAVVAELALWLVAAPGAGAPGGWPLLVAFAVLFGVAWLLIGDVAGSPGTLRRALLAARSRG